MKLPQQGPGGLNLPSGIGALMAEIADLRQQNPLLWWESQQAALQLAPLIAQLARLPWETDAAKQVVAHLSAAMQVPAPPPPAKAGPFPFGGGADVVD